MSRLGPLSAEVRATLALALPVMAGQVGLALMGVVDARMVRPLGLTALAAVGVGEAVHLAVVLFGGGALFGLDAVIARAWGAGRSGECRAALTQGLWVATGLAAVLAPGMRLAAAHLAAFGVAPDVVPLAADYLRALSWGVWPTLLFVALRQALQAMDDVRAANLLLLVANFVNAGANRLFLHGALGLPGLGVAGAGWATTASRFFLCGALAVWARRRFGSAGERRGWRPEPRLCGELLRLGLPAGLTFLLEIGTYSSATLLVSGLGPVPTAAQHVVLTVDQLGWIVPVGLNAAVAVRVGQAIGRGDVAAARRAGSTALGLGIAFASIVTLVFWVAWEPILAPLVGRGDALAFARPILLCTGVVQVFDAAQTVLTGALRGLGETARPLAGSLVGHWIVGLPLGAWLCYRADLGVLGLWIGLGGGLLATALWVGRLWYARAGLGSFTPARSRGRPAPDSTST